jgi:hypothetical protein
VTSGYRVKKADETLAQGETHFVIQVWASRLIDPTPINGTPGAEQQARFDGRQSQ